MLTDTMNQVKAAEQQAAELLQEVRAHAAAIVEDAKAQAAQITEDARKQAEADAKAALAGARQEGEAQKEQFASKVRKELDVSMGQALGRTDAVVSEILAGLV